jgi:hypothetical protein
LPKSINNKLKRHIPFLVPFFTLFLIFLWPLLILKKSFILGDYDVQHFPWAWTLYEALQRGELPHWTPLLANGFPLLAEGQIAPFYFLNLISFKVLPFIAAYTWQIPFHMLLGGLGLYFYARQLKLSYEASALASMIFTFGSSYAGCFYNIGSLRTLSWLPWTLLILVNLRGKSFKNSLCGVIGLGMIFSQQWCAGFPQLALYAMGYCFFHELWVFFEAKKEKRVLINLGLALGLGVLLALPQLLPTWELVRESVRSGESAAFALWGSVNPLADSSLLYPQWGKALRVSFYIGIIPLFLCTALFFAPRPKYLWRHVFLSLLFFSFAMGKFNPIYSWVIETFHLTSMRNPSKFLFFTVTSLSILSAMGFDASKKIATSNRGESWAKIAMVFSAFIALLPFLAAQLIQRGMPLWQRWGEKFVHGLIQEKGINAKPLDAYMEKLNNFFDTLVYSVSYENIHTWGTIFFAAASTVIIVYFVKKTISKEQFIKCVMALLVLDLYFFGTYMGTGFIGNAGKVPSIEIPPRVAQIKSFMGPEDIFAEIVEDPDNEILPPNRNMRWGIRHAGGYSPLLLKRHHELSHDFGFMDASLGRRPFKKDIWEKEKGILDLLGVSVIHSDMPLNLPGLKLLAQDKNLHFYRNLNALPKAAVFYDWKVIKDKSQRLEQMRQSSFDPKLFLILEEGSLEKSRAGGLKTQGMNIMKDAPSLFEAQIKMSQEGMGFIRQTSFPGWDLEVNGEPASYSRAHHAFVAFPLKAGDNEIRLSFHSRLLNPALFISALFWILSIFILSRLSPLLSKNPID